MSVRTTTLSNGMTVITDDMPHLESASLGIWVKAGSRSETEAEHGISHVLEHMAFKGTKSRNALQIAEATLVDLGVAMGPVIASIHDKRDELRAKIKSEADLEEAPRFGSRRLRDAQAFEEGSNRSTPAE